MSGDREILIKLLRLIDRTEAQEIDCEEFLHRSAGLVEALVESKAMPSGWSELVQHLGVCPECEEEFETLRRIIEDEGP